MQIIKGFGIAVLGGAIVAAMVAIVLPRILEEKYEHGRAMGLLDGRQEALRAIEQAFGEELGDGRAEAELFSVKTSRAVAVVIDGVKTVRVAH